MFTIELAYLLGKPANRAKDNVVKTASALSSLSTIPQVLDKKEIIQKVQTDDFWLEADLFEFEMVREALLGPKGIDLYLNNVYINLKYSFITLNNFLEDIL